MKNHGNFEELSLPVGKNFSKVFSITIVLLIGPLIAIPRTAATTFSIAIHPNFAKSNIIEFLVVFLLIMGTIRKKGYKREEKIILVAKSSIIAIIGLCVVYGGLIYLGSRTGNIGNGMSNTSLLLFISKEILGKFGTIGIEIVLAIGCIATSIGLLSASAEFFTRISNNKIKYNYALITMLIVTGVIASVGLGKIISISTIVLDIIYPVTIVIILLNLIKTMIRSNFVFKLCAYVTLIVSILDEIPSIAPIMNHIPLTNLGFGWIIPFIITFIIATLLPIKNIDDNNKKHIDNILA